MDSELANRRRSRKENRYRREWPDITAFVYIRYGQTDYGGEEKPYWYKESEGETEAICGRAAINAARQTRITKRSI